ncbi:MAG: hypothetical protein JST04_00910 [Bdellovibrionales bacterium]|nr:hypothetical protein [Bdellovibrionales bacterium]
MKLSKRQQRLRDKKIAETGLNEAGKVIYLVKDPTRHTNKNLRPDYNKNRGMMVPVSRQYTPELFDSYGKMLRIQYVPKKWEYETL